MNLNPKNRERREAVLPWRDEAINVSLRAGNASQRNRFLLMAIRRVVPKVATQTLYADHKQVLAFLQQQGPLRPLLVASHNTTIAKSDEPFFGWYAIEWQGARIEVVLPPGMESEIICMSRDEEALRAYAREMFLFALRPSGRCLRFSGGWEDAPDLDAEIGRVTWDDIVLPPPILKQMRGAIEGFFEHKQAVRDFGFAWRRGVLLVGPPGTGKTMVCKAAAAALPALPFLYVRALHPNQVGQVFERARQLSPCLLAFEDIDGFVTPENRTVFLNELDGFADNDGILTIASSNHPGKIDEALLKRPSRFDRVFHLGLPAHDERRAFCERILERSALAARMAPGFDRASFAEQVAAKTDGFTPAYLKEALVSAALEQAQAGATILDKTFTLQVLEQVEELRAHIKKARNPDSMGDMRSVDDVIGFRR